MPVCSDVAAIVAYRSEDGVSRFQDWLMPVSHESILSLLSAQSDLPGPVPGRRVHLIVEDSEQHQTIGDVAIALDEDGAGCELGYNLASDFQGRGLGREILSAVVEALASADVLRFVATVDPENIASVRLLVRCGFTFQPNEVRPVTVRGQLRLEHTYRYWT